MHFLCARIRAGEGAGVAGELLGKSPGLLSGNRGQIRDPRGKTGKGLKPNTQREERGGGVWVPEVKSEICPSIWRKLHKLWTQRSEQSVPSGST